MAHYKINLTWVAPKTGDPVNFYRIKRAPSTVGGLFTTIGTSTGTAYSDTNVTPGTWAYVVCSVNTAGESVPCPQLVLTLKRKGFFTILWDWITGG